ncbi:DNA-methyltransferase [Parasphingorhabdus cellanae]|uniref:DNA-methyltransferase n=1 Tax=Parasphingorhabdus cellanae TaxID=2806553 RepID=UPI001FB052FF|nr:site-specific DNA-methyltransferase [Parasphingorhabdus cellanae]
MLASELQGPIDLVLDDADDSDPAKTDSAEDVIPPRLPNAAAISGDIWQLGRHGLICGDAQNSVVFAQLLGTEQADLLFTDPPYNVKIDGHVCGLGNVRHRDFAFASGEMSQTDFTTFLSTTLGHASGHMRDGSIAYVCMDWRHMGELLAAGNTVFTELKNLIVWNKTNGGMGTFYRSKHELVFVFKKGIAPHTNSFGLGESGRYRTNVWDYAGISSISASRDEELAMHPTVKPVALVADAIRDCSRRGEIILDCFGGSGFTLIAAHKTGRCARLIEYDPLYCDTIVTRWQDCLPFAPGNIGLCARNGRGGQWMLDVSGSVRKLVEPLRLLVHSGFLITSLSGSMALKSCQALVHE